MKKLLALLILFIPSTVFAGQVETALFFAQHNDKVTCVSGDDCGVFLPDTKNRGGGLSVAYYTAGDTSVGLEGLFTPTSVGALLDFRRSFKKLDIWASVGGLRESVSGSFGPANDGKIINSTSFVPTAGLGVSFRAVFVRVLYTRSTHDFTSERVVGTDASGAAVFGRPDLTARVSARSATLMVGIKFEPNP